MGNFVNRESWVGQQQLRFVEETAWWNGTLSRGEIMEKFKCSPQQATAIIQSYLELNPKAIKYSPKVRKYLASARMKCVLGSPCFTDQIKSEEEVYGGIIHSTKGVDPKVARNLIVAMRHGKSLKISYLHNRLSEPDERRISPHAFGYDGSRHLVRAWCDGRKSYRDFFLNRIMKIYWPDNDNSDDLPLDHYWNTWDEVRIKINPLISEDIQDDLMQEHGLDDLNTPIIIKCRQAMKPHVLFRLGLDPYSIGSTAFFEMV